MQINFVNCPDIHSTSDISTADSALSDSYSKIDRNFSSHNPTSFPCQAILKTNKWREEYGVKNLPTSPAILNNADKARVLKHRDCSGRPVIYIPAKNHNASTRDIDELTKFIVNCLEEACDRAFEEVIDNLCIVFDLAEFSTSCMDYQLIKNLIWLLGRHYPERLGICLIINSPTIFSTVWPVIRGWLDENTSKKVVFANTEAELCNYLIPDILPTDM